MLITPRYAALNAELHARVPTYGTGGHRWAKYVTALARKAGATSVLDYGAGKCSLAAALSDSGLLVSNYDPGVPGLEARPVPADIVVCGDVLEHVEEECIRWVLADIVSLARKAVVLSISCRVGNKTLADGRPAHILVRPKAWWAYLLTGYGKFVPIPERDPTQYSVVARFDHEAGD